MPGSLVAFARLLIFISVPLLYVLQQVRTRMTLLKVVCYVYAIYFCGRTFEKKPVRMTDIPNSRIMKNLQGRIMINLQGLRINT